MPERPRDRLGRPLPAGAGPGAAGPVVVDIAGLDDRELDVLHGMAVGGTNQQIAASLQLSQSTVKATVGRILSKLDAANRLQAVRLAVRAGLI